MVIKKVTYRKNYLDSVTLRLDFDKVELSKLSDFSKKILVEFPYQETKKAIVGQVKIDFKANSIGNTREEATVWEYLDTYKNKKLRINSDYISIEYQNRSYKDINDLLKDSKEIIKVFIESFGIQTITRLGLRYINRFDFHSEVRGIIDWKKFFNTNIISGITFSNRLKYPLARTMSQTYFKLDNSDMIFNYGIWNQDFPNKNVSKEFILDIDCFSRFPLENISVINEVITQYNKNIQAVFEKSITEETRKILKK